MMTRTFSTNGYMSVSSTPVKKKANESSDLLGYPLEVRIVAPCKGSERLIALSIYKKKDVLFTLLKN